MIEIKKYTLDGYDLSPVIGTISLKDYYGYNTTFTASAAPTVQESYCFTVFFYKDLTTGKVGLVGILSKHDDGIDGSFQVKITGLPSYAELVFSDDPGEATFDPDTGTLTGNFSWAGCCTDGFAIDNVDGFTELKIEITSAKNINKIKYVNSDGTAYYKNLTIPYTITSTPKIITLNDYLYLNPSPGIYFQDPLNIEIFYSDEIKSVLNGIDKPPALAKYIAYDTLNPPNPFIAVVQDGKGNVTFDGGFPKFYNERWDSSWTTWSDMAAQFKYLANVFDFIANKEKIENGNKKILILGDAISSESYCIKDTDSTDFYTSFTGVANIVGYELTFKTRDDYTSGLIDCTYDELNEYCGVVLMSSHYGSTPLITDNAVESLLLFREAGNGIFIITDHGIDIPDIETAKTFPYSSGCYFTTANKLVVNFGAWFSGNYDRSPVNVGFLRETYGDSPLYNNLSDDEDIYAGASESRIFITESNPVSPSELTSIEVTGDGYHDVNFLLELTDGSLITRKYTYGLNVATPLIVKDDQGNKLTGIVELTTNKLSFNLITELTNQTFSGYIKINDTVVGEFSYNDSFTTTYYEGYDYPLTVKDGDIVSFLITTPFKYTVTFTIHILFSLNNTFKLPLLFKALEKYFNKKIYNSAKYFAGFGDFKPANIIKNIKDNNFDPTKPFDKFTF